jgi:hypothetical protein
VVIDLIFNAGLTLTIGRRHALQGNPRTIGQDQFIPRRQYP